MRPPQGGLKGEAGAARLPNQSRYSDNQAREDSRSEFDITATGNLAFEDGKAQSPLKLRIVYNLVHAFFNILHPISLVHIK